MAKKKKSKLFVIKSFCVHTTSNTSKAIEPYLQWLFAAGEENVITEKDEPNKIIFDCCHVFKNICNDIIKYDISKYEE